VRLPAESLGGAGLGLGGFLFAIFRWSRRRQRSQEASGDGGDIVDSGVEGGFIGLRWFGEAADFADELEGGGADFVLGDGRIEIEERFDISAHVSQLG
jgi:hypothetical protein